MAYDQPSNSTEAGGRFCTKWIEEQVDWFDKRVDLSKVIPVLQGVGGIGSGKMETNG